jgi:hypothetical protein
VRLRELVERVQRSVGGLLLRAGVHGRLVVCPVALRSGQVSSIYTISKRGQKQQQRDRERGHLAQRRRCP